jgi:cytochrome c nitrite reductase small subunit
MPGRTLALIAVALAGAVVGIGVYTADYAEATSYFNDAPEACVNCHVMREQYEGWQHSSHRRTATCNDCHTPKDFAGKWTTKALNGWHHSVAFTTGEFAESRVDLAALPRAGRG